MMITIKNTIISTIVAAIFAILLLCCASGTKDQNPEPIEPAQDEDILIDNIKLSDISEKKIPIIAWAGIAHNSSALAWKSLQDANFTINWGFNSGANSTEIFNGLDRATTNGIQQLIAYNPYNAEYTEERDISKWSAENKNKLKNHPGFWGYFIDDEPRQAAQFTELANKIREIRQFDNGNQCYINLAAGLDSEEWAPELLITGTEPTRARIFYQRYLSEIPLSYLSFDCYPVRANKASKERSVYKYWYKTLETISFETKKAGKEFWAFALATEHDNVDIYCPIPTINDLRLQVYSNLAYGAQCIQYFTYSQIERFGQAPIMGDGSNNFQLTSTYFLIQQMNKEIAALSPVFLDAKMKWVAHTGIIPEGCTPLDKTKLPNHFSDLQISGGKGALVSLMEKGNDNFLIVQNHDINEEIKVKVKGSKDLFIVKKDAKIYSIGEKERTLLPGDALIFFWKK